MDDRSPTVTDDAQRNLERRALRNVRSLVDNLENRDRMDSRRSVRLLAVLLVATAVVVGLGYAAVRMAQGPGASRVITADPKAPDAPRVTPR